MALPQLSAPPTDTPLIELPTGPPDRPLKLRDFTGIIKKQWSDWLVFSLLNRAQQTSQLLTSVALVNQAASLGASPFLIGVVQQGLYRVHWRVRITQPATVNSSLIVAIGSMDAGQVCSDPGPAITGNTVATIASGTSIVLSDGNAPITYSFTYVSNGAVPMQFKFNATIERIA